MANLLKIKTIANEKKISLKEIADYLSMTPTGLSKIIRENSTKTTTLEKIAVKLKVPVSVFFDDESNSYAEPEQGVLLDMIAKKDAEISRLNRHIGKLEQEIKEMGAAQGHPPATGGVAQAG